MAGFHVVIPARFASQRLPGKPLLDIAGRPMLEHVYRRASESGAETIVVATDDRRIRQAVEAFGGEVCMTAESHQSGTDRIAEVARHFAWPDDTLVVNLQGDEPLMPPTLLKRVADTLRSHADADLATLAVPLSEPDEVFDPNVVKVVIDRMGYALYFSRAPIPWQRDVFAHDAEARPEWLDGMLRHLGIYAYRAGFLERYSELPASPIERMESLEQLRVLWNGGRVAIDTVEEAPPPGVDTNDDLERVNALLSAETR